MPDTTPDTLPGREAGPSTGREDDPLLDEFIERVGVIAQEEGFPRIAGRIIGLLIYSGEELSFSQLAERLDVSRGSISTNARMLADRGIVERVGKPGDRQDWFRVGDDAFENLLRAAGARAAKAHASIGKVRDRLRPGPARERLTRYAAFYRSIERSAEEAARRIGERTGTAP